MAERVLVTGASGFIGSHLARRLLHEGHDVVALVRPTSDLWRLADVLESLELMTTELQDRPRVGTLDSVFHLAAAGVRPDGDSRELVETNVAGTIAALELAAEARAGRFLYCGSCFEYGPGERHREDALPRPISPYGAAKAAGWLFAEAWGRAAGGGAQVVSVRPFTVYGPYEASYRLVPSISLGVARCEPVELTAGHQSRDFVYVDDAVDAMVAAVRSGAAGTFNICTGISTSVRELATQLASLAGGDLELRFGKLPTRAAEFPTLSGDPSHTGDVLGWTASTALEAGLRRTLEWFREHERRRPHAPNRASR